MTWTLFFFKSCDVAEDRKAKLANDFGLRLRLAGLIVQGPLRVRRELRPHHGTVLVNDVPPNAIVACVRQVWLLTPKPGRIDVTSRGLKSHVVRERLPIAAATKQIGVPAPYTQIPRRVRQGRKLTRRSIGQLLIRCPRKRVYTAIVRAVVDNARRGSRSKTNTRLVLQPIETSPKKPSECYSTVLRLSSLPIRGGLSCASLKPAETDLGAPSEPNHGTKQSHTHIYIFKDLFPNLATIQSPTIPPSAKARSMFA